MISELQEAQALFEQADHALDSTIHTFATQIGITIRCKTATALCQAAASEGRPRQAGCADPESCQFARKLREALATP